MGVLAPVVLGGVGLVSINFSVVPVGVRVRSQSTSGFRYIPPTLHMIQGESVPPLLSLWSCGVLATVVLGGVGSVSVNFWF